MRLYRIERIDIRFLFRREKYCLSFRAIHLLPLGYQEYACKGVTNEKSFKSQ
jgi:hypothetical protein